MKKQIQIKKLPLVEVPAEHQKNEGCVAFQMIEYTINYFGNLITGTVDTKIGLDGDQRVHGGDGYFKDGKVIV